MDYAMPRAADVPSFVLVDHPAPAKTNPLGVKGCGEAGCAGALTSVMNAVIDALGDHGIRHLDMPLDAVPRLEGAARRQSRHPPRRHTGNDRSRCDPFDPSGRVAADRGRLCGTSGQPLLHVACWRRCSHSCAPTST